MRKTLKLLWCIVPFLLMNLFQVIVVVAVMVIIVITMITNNQTSMGLESSYIEKALLEYNQEITTWGLFLFQALGSVLAASIFLRMSKSNKRMKQLTKLDPRYWTRISVFLLMIILFSQMISYAIVDLFEVSLQSAYQSYIQLLENSGLSNPNIVIIVAVVLFAPICEELVFRGITLELAGRGTNQFWLMNTIQAFFFGLSHMNLVQSTYAFVLGLMLGVIRKKTDSIIIPIIVHILFNLCGVLLPEQFEGLLENNIAKIVIYTCSCLITLAVLVVLPQKNVDSQIDVE